MKAALAKLDAIGVKPLSGAMTDATAVASDEAHMAVPNPAEAEAWYAKYFGTNIWGTYIELSQGLAAVK